MSRRFKHWAYLNDEGKKSFGEAFPDGEVPVVSMIPQRAYLGGGDTPSTIYMVRVDDLAPEQFAKLLDLLVEKFKAPRDAMEKDFRENGIPLREELTSGAGTNQVGLFIPDFDDDDYDDDDYEDEEEASADELQPEYHEDEEYEADLERRQKHGIEEAGEG